MLDRLIAGVAVVVYCGSAANADFHTGNDIHEYCQRPDGRQAVMMYASGVIGGSGLHEEKFYCIPKEAKLGQVADIVCQFLAANPQTRHFPGGVLVARSLRVAWPCPTPKP